MMMNTNPLAEDLDHILEHTRELWEELRGERIFITGGTGFFGCWLLESLCWAADRLHLNVQATVLTRQPAAFHQKAPHLANHLAVRLCQGDVRDFAFPEGSYLFVIHAATESSSGLNAERPLLMLDTIVTGTRRTLDFALFSGTKKYLLTSSGAVYGKQPPEMTHIPEDYPGAPNPMDPSAAYGTGKRMAEHLCALYASQHGIETKIARCFAFVGPYLPLDTHFAIGNFIRDALNGGPIVVKGDGAPYRSYLYAADLAIWLWTILVKGESCHPYNVGSDQFFTIREIADSVSASFPTPFDVQVRKPAQPGKPAARYVPAIQKAKDGLALQVRIDLSDSIRKTVRWHQEKIPQ